MTTTAPLIPRDVFERLYLDLSTPVRDVATHVGGIRRVYYLARKYDIPLRKHLSDARREYLRKKLVGGLAHEIPYHRLASHLDMSDKALDKLISYHCLENERNESFTRDDPTS
ncbi:hypothetical protein [Amycolatopsis sp. YIM 10]|uniref:hypothetical protein n=1 Tax=Amycolatopsis sp. YIM 10 TaxID=2653857 RepID=UPI0012902202|nr:hypothetical protein [Amycolatopsis sp. YIM 10]QFU86686.1 hypothetical protein YIM_07375 [Amycolatopsis sp. YIM 10]